MKNSRWLNFAVGLFVLSGILAFSWLAFSASDADGRFKKQISVSASFNNVGSLKARAPVMMSGVRVGKVKSINLHTDNFVAVVEIDIDENFHIPRDSIASIQTAGLVGEQYIGIQPGQSSVPLLDGDSINLTKSAMVLESLLESFSSSGVDNIDLADGVTLTASFDNIGALKINAPVMVSGVRIGSVKQISLNSDSYVADIALEVSSKYLVPSDSVISIQNSGILGEQYIALEPGVAKTKLQDGDRISLTKSAMGLDGIFNILGGNNVDNTNIDDQVVVTANFTNIGTLKPKAPVMISGVRVGNVSNISLDLDTFLAVVELTLDARYGIPVDTSASIYTSGIIGQQYVALDPGGSFEDLKTGDRIRLTQPALVIERLVGQLLTSMTSGSSATKSDDTGSDKND